MGEQYNFARGWQGKETGETNSPSESLISADKLAQIAANNEALIARRAVEASEQFQKALQEAMDLINPLLERINKLPDAERMQLVSSIKDIDGPAYDAVRKQCC